MKIRILPVQHDEAFEPTVELAAADVDLIADECSISTKRPPIPMMGINVATRLNKQWVSIDPSMTERVTLQLFGDTPSPWRWSKSLQEIVFGESNGEERRIDPGDSAREWLWACRIVHSEVNSVLVVCGAMHAEALCTILLKLGHEATCWFPTKGVWPQMKIGPEP